jgi:hypothetical protein
MRKIYSFSKFNAIYEEETSSSELNVTETEASKLYDQTLGLILTTILNSYNSETYFPSKEYTKANIDLDLLTVKNTPVLNKPAEFVEILQKVQKAAADNKLEGAKEAVDAWFAAGTKSTEALTVMINQYKDQPEELTHINNFINAKLDSFLEEIEIAAEDNELEAELEESYTGEIFEGLFQGKKGMIGDVSRQINLVNAKLASLAQTPGMAAEIQRLQNEVAQISAKMGDLLEKPNKDINKEDIKKAAIRLAEIPGEVDKIAEKMLKEDSINKEAASIQIQAYVLLQIAVEKEKEYLQKKEQAVQRETADVANAAEKAREEKVKVKVADYIEFDKDSVKKVNDEVKKVQQLIIDKFGGIPEIKELPQYLEFSRFGTDGKFGPRTQEMIKIIQKGLEMDPSGNISPDFVYRVQTEDVVNESARSIFKFKEFNSLLESFKIKAAVEYAKKRPSFSSSLPSSGSRSSGSSGVKVTSNEVVKEAEKSEFGKKSAEEKWDWLTKTYVVGAKPGTAKVTSASPDTYNGKKIIRIVLDGYTVSDLPATIVCWYPEGNSLGKYIEYIYPDGKIGVQVSEGKWGDKIETEGITSSGNFLEIKEYPFDKKKVGSAKKVSSDAVIKEIARDIVKATSAAGTNPTRLVDAIKKIQSKGDLDAVNAVIKSSYDNYKATSKDKYLKGKEILGIGAKDGFLSSDYSDLKSTINSELESDNGKEIISIVNHLKGKGINASYTPYLDKYSKKPSSTSWITNTFSY